MTEQQIPLSAKNYSEALIKIVRDNILSYEEVQDDLNTISQILDMSEDLRMTLQNPTITDEIKSEITDEVFGKEIHPELVNFLKILIEKKRFGEFYQIKADYAMKLDEINNIQTVEIISAVPLNSEYQEQIITKLKGKLNKNIRPNWSINEDIIAGLIFKISDDVIDTSIKNKLDKLNKNLM